MAHDLLIEAESPYLALNRHQLELEFRDVEDQCNKSGSSKFRTILTAVGFSLTFSPAYTGSRFRSDVLGLPADTWQTLALIGLVVSVAVAGARRFGGGLYSWRHRDDPKLPTPAERVQRLIQEMESG